ncbi:MAG TPA: HIT family protein [Burkholderiaceae bacterium]|nr:HIT family protein [Burkholderiaceae bacterium]
MTTDHPTGGHGPQHDCIFCRIAAGEIPAHVIHEDDQLKAFLDIHPIRPGHVLIIPKAHYDYYESLPAQLAAAIVHLGQRLGRAMKAAYGVERVAFLFTGTDVAHVHAHVVPMHEKTDITSPVYIEQQGLSFRLAPRADDAGLRETVELLNEHLSHAPAAK